MVRKSTIVISAKIPTNEYENLLPRVKNLYDSRSIMNCTVSSYIIFLVMKDLRGYGSNQFQNLLKILDSNIMSGLPRIKSHFPMRVLSTINSRNTSTRIIGDDAIPDFIPSSE